MAIILVAAPSFAQETYTFPEVKMKQFENGLTLYYAHMPEEERFRLECYVWGGRHNEPQEFPGISHLLEHLLFRQSDIAPDAFKNQIKEKGGQFNGTISLLDATYYVQLPNEHLAFGVDWLFRVLHHEQLPFDQLESEKKIIRIEKGWDDPLWMEYPKTSIRLLNDFLFYPEQHRKSDFCSFWEESFGIDLSHRKASPLSIARITPEDLQKYYKTWYVPSNMTLVYVGANDIEEILPLTSKTFSTLPASTAPKSRPLSPTHSAAAYQYTDVITDIDAITVGHMFTDSKLASPAFISLYASILKQLLTDILRYREDHVYSVDIDRGRIWRTGYVRFGIRCPRTSMWTNYDKLQGVLYDDLSGYLNQEDYRKYHASFIKGLFVDQKYTLISSLLGSAIKNTPNHIPEPDMLKEYEALQQIDYPSFLEMTQKLRAETAAYGCFHHSNYIGFPLFLSMFFAPFICVLFLNSRRQKRSHPKTVIWKTNSSFLLKLSYGFFLFCVSIIVELWTEFPLQIVEHGAPKISCLMQWMLIIPESIFFACIWLSFGSLLPSKLIAGESALHLYSMGWRRKEIPYAALERVVLSRAYFGKIARVPKVLKGRIRQYTFRITPSEVQLHFKDGKLLILATSEPERWTAIIEEQIAKQIRNFDEGGENKEKSALDDILPDFENCPATNLLATDDKHANKEKKG